MRCRVTWLTLKGAERLTTGACLHVILLWRLVSPFSGQPSDQTAISAHRHC